MILLVSWLLLATEASCYYNARYTETKYLLFETFVGHWNKVEQSTSLNNLTETLTVLGHSHGDTLLTFGTKHNNADADINGVTLKLLQPLYINEPFVELQIFFDQPIAQGDIKWKGNANMTVTLWQNDEVISLDSLFVDYMISKEFAAISIDGEMLLWIRYAREAKHTFEAALTFIYFALICKFAKRRLESEIQTAPEMSRKHNVVSIVLLLSLNMFISWVLLILGLSTMFNRLSLQILYLPAGMFNLSLLAKMFKHFQSLIFDSNQRPMVSLFVSIAFQWILLFGKTSSFVYYSIGLLLVPQCWSAFKRGHKFNLDMTMLGYVTTTVIFVCYFKFISPNLFRESPELMTICLVAGMFLASLALLVGQSKLGPRFFLPKCLRPNHYNYTKSANGQECPICLCEIQGKMMMPPCGHKFHIDCLERWMVVAMTCPIDRSVLPCL